MGTRWSLLACGIPVHVHSVTWSDTATGLQTHQGLITPQVTRPSWHPFAEMWFYEDWKLTRQVFPFKSVRICIKLVGRSRERWLDPWLLLREAGTLILNAAEVCRHNSMGGYTIYENLVRSTGCLVLGVVNIIFSGLGQAMGRGRGQLFSNDQNNTLSM